MPMFSWFRQRQNRPDRQDKKALLRFRPPEEVLAPLTSPPSETGKAVDLTLEHDQILWVDEQQRKVPLVRDHRLTVDITAEARELLASRIARLLPHLQAEEQQLLLEYTLLVLHILSQDQLVRVRRMVAEELKDSTLAAHDTMLKLAWDTEFAVSAPVLQYSPVLNEQDLLEILQHCPVPGVATAIAQRRLGVTPKVSQKIIRHPEKDAVAALLQNNDAAISPRGYRTILQQLESHPEWQEALVQRPDLPLGTVNRLARILSDALIEQLCEHQQLPEETREKLQDLLRKRLTRPSLNRQREAAAHAQALYDLDILDEAMLEKAIQKADRGFVGKYLSVHSGFPMAVTERMLASGNPKVLTSLCWKAGISARMCLQIQLRIGKLHHHKALIPKGGDHYPLPESAMELYLDVYRQAQTQSSLI